MLIENPLIWFTAFPIAAYAIGSTPFGVIITRCAGIDIRKVGSGNVGATNVGRAMGRPWGIFCFMLDVAKGLLPTLAAGWLIGCNQQPSVVQQAAWLTTGASCILGHIFSFYLKGRGGKGVATSLGVVLGVYPWFTWTAVCAFALWCIVTGISKYVSLGSIVAAVAFLPLFYAINAARTGMDITIEMWPLAVFAGIMSLLIVVKHRSNIRRLLSGEENRIGRGKRSSDERSG